MKKGFIIAIDGPLASGKGTIAQKLAEKCNAVHLNSGAMYRCLALYCIDNGINLHDQAMVTAQLVKIHIVFTDDKIEMNGHDVTKALLHANIAEGASVIATMPSVRKNLVKRQQKIGRDIVAEGKIVVAEGRDTATAVFPQAPIKIYLTASEEIRAKRRLAQMQASDKTITLDHVLELVKKRDQRDTERKTDPLPTEPEKLGYTLVDNSGLTVEQTVDEIVKIIKKRELHND